MQTDIGPHGQTIHTIHKNTGTPYNTDNAYNTYKGENPAM